MVGYIYLLLILLVLINIFNTESLYIFITFFTANFLFISLKIPLFFSSVLYGEQSYACALINTI